MINAMTVYKESMLAYMLASRVNKLPKYIKSAHIELLLKDFDLNPSNFDGLGSQLFINSIDKKHHNYAKFTQCLSNDKFSHSSETVLLERVKFLFASDKPALFNSGSNISFEEGSVVAQMLHSERVDMFSKKATLIWRHQPLDPKAYPKSFSSHYPDPALNDNIIDLVIGAHTAKKNGRLFPVYEYNYSGWGIVQALDRLPAEIQKHIHFICISPAQNPDMRFWDTLERSKAKIDVLVSHVDFLPSSLLFHNNMPGNAVDMSGNIPVTSVTNPLINYYFIEGGYSINNCIKKSALCESLLEAID
jgi:hypothetical protein